MLPPRPAKATFKRLPELGVDIGARVWGLSELVARRTFPWIAAEISGFMELRRQSPPAEAASRGAVVVVATYHGERAQVRPFLDYHRALGIAEFVFLDLSADGHLDVVLSGASDCTVWRPRRRASPRRVLYWTNYLRRRFGSGRWCLSLETSERFVFLRCESRHIGDLIQFLESERRDHIFALVVDMYGEARACEIHLGEGQDPADALPYFDWLGYGAAEPGPYSSVVIRGGPLRRTLYREAPRESPALNRTPLVKFRWYYGYVTGRNLMLPRRLNAPHADWHTSPTACLLRYALLEDDSLLAQRARLESAGDRPADLPLLREAPLKHDFSARYSTSEDLVSAGLLNPGQWF